MNARPDALSFAERPAELGDLSPRAAGWMLVALTLASAAGRIVLHRFIPGPAIWNDELHYVELARGFLEGRRMLFAGVDTAYPNWLYPMLIAPILAAWPMPQAHALILGLNAVVGSLTTLPVYAWARSVTSRRRALLAAALTALLPGLGYSGMVMTECLFLLAATTALWLIHRALLVPTFERLLLAGLVSGAAFHVKPHALLLPPVIALAALWHHADRLRGGRWRSGREWAQGAGALVPLWVAALGWVLGMAPRALEVFFVERPGESLTVASLLGGYGPTAAGVHPAGAVALVASVLGYAAGWVLASGGWAAWRTLCALGADDREAGGLHAPAARLHCRLTLAMAGAMALLVARHTLVADDHWRLHERYFFVTLPGALIALAASPGGSVRRRGAVWARMAAFTLLAMAAAIFIRPMIWTVLSDSPSLAGLLLWIRRERLGGSDLPAAFTALGVLGAGVWIGAGGRRGGRWAATALLLLWFNVGWYGAQYKLNRRWTAAPRAAALDMVDRLGHGDRLLCLIDDLPIDFYRYARFQIPGKAIVLDETNRPWWAEPAASRLTPDGRLASPFAQERTWLLAAPRWRFNRPPDALYGDPPQAALYRVSGPSPLRLEPDQPLPDGIRIAADPAPLREPRLENLRLTLLELRTPDEWRAGQTRRVVLRLRNDSLFAIPGAPADWRIGYHWFNPSETGNWTAVVWDDGRDVPLPPNTPPGGEMLLWIDAAAPDRPGRGWLFSLHALTVEDGARRWHEPTFGGAWLAIEPQP